MRGSFSDPSHCQSALDRLPSLIPAAGDAQVHYLPPVAFSPWGFILVPVSGFREFPPLGIQQLSPYVDFGEDSRLKASYTLRGPQMVQNP